MKGVLQMLHGRLQIGSHVIIKLLLAFICHDWQAPDVTPLNSLCNHVGKPASRYLAMFHSERGSCTGTFSLYVGLSKLFGTHSTLQC